MQPGGIVSQTGAYQPGNDDRGVVRPHRSAVIAQWRIAGIGRRHRAQSKAGIQSWAR